MENLKVYDHVEWKVEGNHKLWSGIILMIYETRVGACKLTKVARIKITSLPYHVPKRKITTISLDKLKFKIDN